MRRSEGPDGPERSYLSIREVLELLVTEFPNVTISKIRFLESRGLIQPERTPSGYRKFYDADVERLAWILRQQRENFLPLKVIKGRLDQARAAGRVVPFEAALFDEETASLTEKAPALVGVASHNGSLPRAGETRPLEQAHVPSTLLDEADGGDWSEPSVSMAVIAPRMASEPAAFAQRFDEPQEPQKPSAPEAVISAASEVIAEPSSEVIAEPPTSAVGPTQRIRDARLSATSLSAEELAGATGADVALIASLESFGLIASREVAGERCYDEQAVIVAKVAQGFARFGVEPRHLRAIKHAAERDAGLFGQVVLPLLRQRNPAARDRALEDLSELVGLGAELHNAFLQAELHDLTGG